jgi:hypothetical protein
VFVIENLEPQEEIGFAKNIYIVAAVVTAIEGLSALLIIRWSVVDPARVFLGIAVAAIIKFTLLAWFSNWLQKGKMAPVIIQTLLFPLAMALALEGIINADSRANELLRLVWHSYIFSAISLALFPMILIANWTVITKVRRGVLKVVSR